MEMNEQIRSGVDQVVSALLADNQCMATGWVLVTNYINPDGERATGVTVAPEQSLVESASMSSYSGLWFDVLQRAEFVDALEEMEDEMRGDPDVQGF